MVNFRYHITSLVAVFLALGLGLIMGVTLADDDGMREEQRALIESIEHSLGSLRSENRTLQGELASMLAAIAYYDEVLSEAGDSLLGTGLTDRTVAFFSETAAESTAQELRSFLQRLGVQVRTIVWLESEQKAGDRQQPHEQLQKQRADALAALLLGEGIAEPLEGLIANGNLRLDGTVEPVDSILLILAAPNSLMAETARNLSGRGNRGIAATIGQAEVDQSRRYEELGWSTVSFIETLPGRVRLATMLTRQPELTDTLSGASLSP